MSFLDNLYRLSQETGETESSDSFEETQVGKADAQMILQNGLLLKILLIDDDPIFGKIMERIAKQLKINLTFCQSVADLSSIKDWTFDVAVIDYDLGSVTGVELGSYLEEYAASLPLVLVSNNGDAAKKKLPVAIQGFVHKKLGPYAILKAAAIAKSNAAEKKPFKIKHAIQ